MPPTSQGDRLGAEIIAAYGHPSRAYHDAGHLRACLALLDAHAAEARSADEIELAIWFHDAIYRTRRSDNEEQSAEWARTAILEAGLGPELADRVAALVLATQHAATPADPDARLLVDIDLAILGSPPEEFDRYDEAVRREYRWVPAFLYRRKRLEVLESFLARDSIFLTEAFRARYESPARRNLRRAVERLRE